MKRILMVCLSGGLALTLVSCGPRAVREGDSAYESAKKAEGDARRTFEKSAYMNYKQAVNQYPDKITTKLRNRFVEMAVVRGKLILREGSYQYDAVPLLLEEVDKYWSPEITDTVRNLYAGYLVELADSAMEHSGITKALANLDRAISISQDKAFFTKEKHKRVDSLVSEFASMAKNDFSESKSAKDPEDMVRAEFYSQLVLLLDSTRADMREILSDARKENVCTYSVYKKVIEPQPDTALFKRVNKYDIFFSISSQAASRSGLTMKVRMWNYSYNAQHLKPENFAIEDETGKKLTALPSSVLKPEFLDQQFQTEVTLVFPAPSGKVHRLIYDNSPHYSEKVFY